MDYADSANAGVSPTQETMSRYLRYLPIAAEKPANEEATTTAQTIVIIANVKFNELRRIK